MGNLENIYNNVITCPFSGDICDVLKSEADIYVNSDRTILEKQRLLAGSVWRLRDGFKRYGDEIKCAEGNSGCNFRFDEPEQ